MDILVARESVGGAASDIVSADGGGWCAVGDRQRWTLDFGRGCRCSHNDGLVTLVCACLMDKYSWLAVRVDLCVAAANAANTHHAVYFEASDWALAAIGRPGSSAV
jgi:hypothetical protein